MFYLVILFIEIISKKSILLLSSELQNDVTRLVLSTLGGSDSDENGRIESDSESEDQDDEEYEEQGSDRIDSFWFAHTNHLIFHSG